MIDVRFDLDGVLADFDKAYFGQSVVEQDRKFDESKFVTFVNDDGFLNLAPIESGFDMLSRLYALDDIRISILGSTASKKRGTEFGQEVVRQKQEWLHEQLMGYYISSGFIEQNFVTHRGQKKLFATPKSILIDDCAENVEEFTQAGGYGILYNMNHDTEETYQKILDAIHQIKAKNNLY